MMMTSEKTAVRDGDDIMEDSDSRRQLPLCELMTTKLPRSQLTPSILKDGQISEKEYIWETRHVLRGNAGLVETQLGC